MKKVFILDDDKDVCEALGQLFELFANCRCVISNSMAEMLEHGDEALQCDCALLDIKLGAGPTGLDAYRWLKEHGFKGKLVFLTGHAASNPSVQEARNEGALIVEKPPSVDVLLELVK
jgi:FixJ family two-component response regulator